MGEHGLNSKDIWQGPSVAWLCFNTDLKAGTHQMPALSSRLEYYFLQ